MSNARKLADNLPTEGPLTGRNMVINGDMRIDQRNSGSAVSAHNTNLFPVDRFRCIENTGGSVSMQRVQDAPAGFYYSLKFTVTGTDTLTGTEFSRALHPIEGSNIAHLNWGTSNAKTCTLSFYVKSSVAGQYYVNIFNGSANRVMVKGYTIDAANTWERKVISVVGDTSGTWTTSDAGTGIFIGWHQGTGPDYIVSSTDTWGGTFDMVGANQVNLLATNAATWQLTGVQFEVGANNATPFEHESYSDSLRKCQRYYWQAVGSGPHYYATQYSSGYRFVQVDFGQEMRVTPTVTVSYAAGASLTTYLPNRQHWKAYLAANYSATTSYRSDILKLDAEL